MKPERVGPRVCSLCMKTAPVGSLCITKLWLTQPFVLVHSVLYRFSVIQCNIVDNTIYDVNLYNTYKRLE